MHYITIKDVSIKECQVQYGGGCYIYSQSDENDVNIIRSIFSDNFATRQKETSETKIFFESDKFSKSNMYSKSEYFNETDKFSKINDFIKTEHFSNTVHFSIQSSVTSIEDLCY